MKSQMGYLNVVGKSTKGFKKICIKNFQTFLVSPDIIDDPSSHDIIVQEFENVTLCCTATGSPGERSFEVFFVFFVKLLVFLEPTILWKRERQPQPLNIDNKESELWFWFI